MNGVGEFSRKMKESFGDSPMSSTLENADEWERKVKEEELNLDKTLSQMDNQANEMNKIQASAQQAASGQPGNKSIQPGTMPSQGPTASGDVGYVHVPNDDIEQKAIEDARKRSKTQNEYDKSQDELDRMILELDPMNSMPR